METRLISPRDPGISFMEQVLRNRGIENAYRYINVSEEEVLNPLLLDNMRQGALMLIQHIKANNKIFIQVDEDCDGYTSAALLLNYLNAIFPHFTQHNIRYKTHDCKAHGIVVEEVPRDTKLVIIPDAGSNQFEEHEKLAAAGMEILILDHHNVEGVPAHACLINNQACGYPNKTLSGVGVVYKFCSYLDSLLGRQVAPQFLDLVAVGGVADMIPLNNYETRYFVSKGLAAVNNPFLKGMMIKNEFYLKGELTPHGISFSIAPAVNAIARVGSVDERRILFESMLDFCAYDLVPSTKRGCAGQTETKVEQACRNCTNVRNRQNKDRDFSLETAERLIEENNLLSNPVLFVQFEKEVNENLTGLIANQIAAKYNRPTLVLNHTKEGWFGSGRNVKGTKFDNFQSFLLGSGLMELCAGHNNAFGLGVKEENLEALKQYCKDNLNESYFTAVYTVDIEVEADSLQGHDVLALGEMKDIWGEGVEEPLVLIKNLHVNASNLDFLKGTTIKITPQNRIDGLSYILFKTDESVYETLYSEHGVVTVDVVGKCSRNDWNMSPQIIIEDFEIVKRQAYYF